MDDERTIPLWIRVDFLDEFNATPNPVPTPVRPRRRERVGVATIDVDKEYDWAFATCVPTDRGVVSRMLSLLYPSGSSPSKRRLDPNDSNGANDDSSSRGLGDVTVTVRDKEVPRHDGCELFVPAASCEENAARMLPANATDERSPHDLILLTHLHEPAVVHCLRKRYDAGTIYTDTGPILMAVNPLRPCPNLYDLSSMQAYWIRGENGDDGSTDVLPPHTFAIADRAYRDMLRGLEEARGRNGSNDVKIDQSLLVSGESGAGKTVTTKHIMKYIAMLSQKKAMLRKFDGKNKTSPRRVERELTAPPSPQGKPRRDWKVGSNIEQKVLKSNHILESFGNARTTNNDNSSRFGKFIELRFDNVGALVGATIETYLLEKVRLVCQGPGERNFHVFYEILSSIRDSDDGVLDPDWLSRGVRPSDFKLTSASGTYDRRDGISDRDTYNDLHEAMVVVGFDAEDERNMYALCCALLHASNLTVLSSSFDESRLDGSDKRHLPKVLELTGLARKDFEKTVCSNTLFMPHAAPISRFVSKEKAERRLEAVMKFLYGLVYEFIVDEVNRAMSYDPTRATTGVERAAYIGVLDIFGFEVFERNSFEQLCINYCNESLQQHFNRFVFESEQEEYVAEGIDWSTIEFQDNKDVIELIENRKSGVVPTIDAACKSPGYTDAVLAKTLCARCGNHSRFSANKRQEATGMFEIDHYAGPVEYSTDGFIEKNKDEFPKEAVDLLASSSNPFLKRLAALAKKKSVDVERGRHATTVGSGFVAQLKQLRDRVDRTYSRYVRCLRPNDELLPNRFNRTMIANQLRYSGVLDAVRISRIGFSQRYTRQHFVHRYDLLAVKKGYWNDLDVDKRCESLVRSVSTQIWRLEHQNKEDERKYAIVGDVGIQMGKTKIFLRYHAFQYLENLRRKKHDQVTRCIQRFVRRFLVRRRHVAVITIQRWYRMLKERRRFRSMQRVARFAQRKTRRAIEKQQRRAGAAAKRRWDDPQARPPKSDGSSATDLRIMVSKQSGDKEDAIEMKVVSSKSSEDEETEKRLLHMETEIQQMKELLSDDEEDDDANTVRVDVEDEEMKRMTQSAVVDDSASGCCLPCFRSK